MTRARALLAILLAVTWCSAVWHVDLEALGLMFDHQHHVHEGHAAHHAPGATGDDHEPVFARDVTQVRIAATNVLWFIAIGTVAVAALYLWQTAREREPVPVEGRSDPPLEKAWQFLWRCAPDSAAPPAWR